jgi:hypothetical protein
MKVRTTTLMLMVAAVAAFSQTRPRTAWVYRTALNIENASRPNANKNRLVAVLLSSNFTAFYSTETGSLYMTRSGTARDINDTYSQTAFGQCQTFSGGSVLHQNKASNLWDLLDNGNPTTSRTVFRGYTLKGNTVTLRYAIIAGSKTIDIAETPELASGGGSGLQRSIKVSGLGTGQSVRLRLDGQVASETWTAQSGGTISGNGPKYLTITANGTATLTGTWN